MITSGGRFGGLSSHALFSRIAYQNGTAILDPEGNIVQSHSHAIDSLLAIIAIRKYSDNEFFFVSGFQSDSCSSFGTLTIPYTHPVIGRMDSLGNVSALHHYQLNASECWHLAVGLEVTTNKSVVTWGGGGQGIQWSFFALEADSLGEVVWARHFTHHGSFQFIKELPGGDLLAGINMDTAGAVIARMDSAGNVLWCRSYIRPAGVIHDCVVESDDVFLVAGYTDSIASTNGSAVLPPGYDPKLFLMNLNGVGEVQWCKGYDGDPEWYTRRGLRIAKAQDGDYVIMANIGVQDHNLPSRPFLMKVDQNGDTLWTHSTGMEDYTYATSDLLAYSDGGFLYNGLVYGDFGSATGATYLFKTDASGYLPCYNRSHQLSVSALFPTDSSVTLISVAGASVDTAFVSDATYPPFTIYDGCTFTTGLNDLQVRKGQSLRIRPNPNAGRFTVEFADPLMAESYYSVYDGLGKLLYQRPLPAGSTTEEVDLARFGSGTYVLKFTDPEGVRYERVVLE